MPRAPAQPRAGRARRNSGSFFDGPWISSLTALGLCVFWIAFLLILCAVNGLTPTMTEGGRGPSKLFLIGGVYGVSRPAIEVTWRTTAAGLLGLGALGVCDLAYAQHTRARYWALHIITNMWITLLCLPDLWYVVSDPVNALRESRVDHWPTALVFSIHVYHMAFFRGLHMIDWVHHLLMVVLGAPVMITGMQGPLINFNHFFMCGVPGGLDYAMLFAVKHGWMPPLREKEYNSVINVWFRAPFLIVTACLAYVQNFLQDGIPSWVLGLRVFLVLLCAWNALYFMERVVGNYHVNVYKARQAQKGQPPPPPLAAGDDDPYETEAHVSGHTPGFGMRVSLSRQDLVALESEEDDPARSRKRD